MAAPLIDFTLLWDLGLILLAATLMSYITHMLKQPSLLAYLLAGVLIGPIGLGAMNLSFGGISLGITNISEVLILSELGVAFLLFSVGVETEFSKMFGLGKLLVMGTVMQVALTALVVVFANQYLALIGFEEAIYLGLILAFSSTMIVVKTLSDRRHINTLHGRLMIGFLLVQDVLVILAMPLLADLGNSLSVASTAPVLLQAAALLVLAFLLSRFVYPKLFSFAVQSDELLFLAGLSSCFVFIGLAYLMNFSIAIGAFIAGLALSTLPYNLEVYHKLRGIRDFFVTIFFVTLGMQISPTFATSPLALVALIVITLYIVKPLLFFLITLLVGYGRRIALVVSLSLAQISEFSFVLAAQGYANGTGVLAQTPGLYSLIVTLTAVSMVATPYLMNYSGSAYGLSERIAKALLPRPKPSGRTSRKLAQLESIPDKLQNHILIVGGGTMGYGLATALKESRQVVVVDHDSNVVKMCIPKGISALYGSIDNKEVWERVNLANASILIMAIPDVKASLSLLKYAKSINPKITVFGRSHYYQGALMLYQNGIDYVMMPHVISTNVFLAEFSRYLSTGKISELLHLGDEFMTYLREKTEEEKQAGIRV